MARHVARPGTVPSASGAGPRPARRRTRVLLVVSLSLALLAAVGLGAALLRPPPSGPDDAASTSAGASREVETSTDWVEVLEQLDARRARAFAEGDASRLDQVYVVGSAALRGDRRLLRRYAERGLRVTRLRMRVVDVRLLEAGDAHAVLRVRDRVAAARAERADGERWSLGGDGWSTHRMRLERTDSGWRIAGLRRLH